MRLVLAVLLVLGGIGAAHSDIRGSQFDQRFNAAAKRMDQSVRVARISCSKSECVYSAPPETRVSASLDDGGAISELAAYLPPVARSGLDAVQLLMVLMASFSPDVPTTTRASAVKTLVELAAADAIKRGEITVGKWKYVLRGNLGTDVRVYVTEP